MKKNTTLAALATALIVAGSGCVKAPGTVQINRPEGSPGAVAMPLDSLQDPTANLSDGFGQPNVGSMGNSAASGSMGMGLSHEAVTAAPRLRAHIECWQCR